MALTHAWHDIVHDLQDEMHDLASITKVDAARQAYLALWATFMAVPLLFGIDRFAAVMNENWEGFVAGWVPGSAATAVTVFGIVEIALAVCVAAAPRIGGDLLALWMAFLAVNLFAVGDVHWVAMGTLALGVCALAMARMSRAYHHHEG